LNTLFDRPAHMPLDFLSNPERLRYHVVPSTIEETELRQHFHLTTDDREFLKRFRHAANRLGIAVQIGLIRLMGFLPDNWREQVPTEAISFVAQQQCVKPGHLSSYGGRQPTRSEHFTAILRHLRFRKWEPMDAARLEPWLLVRALEHDEERVLLAMTCLKLRQERIVRPAISTLERLVGGMNELAYQETYRRLTALLTDGTKIKLDALLELDLDLGTTRHRWLIQEAKLSNPSAINSTIDKLSYLTDLGVAAWDTDSLPPSRQRRLALLARNRSNRHLERLPDYKRYAVLVSFLRESLLTLTDESLSMFDAYWENSLAKARRDHDQYQQQVTSAKDTAMQTLGLAVALVLDEAQTKSNELREAIFARVPRAQLTLAWEAAQALLYPTRHSYLTFLAKRYGVFKQFTPRLLGQMNFCQGYTGDDFGAALKVVRELQTGKRRKLPDQPPSDFMKPSWRKFVLNEQGECDRHHYELGVLATLRDRLRSGDVYVEQSRRYADLNSYLIPPAEWETARDELCRQLNLPALSTDRITQRIDELETLLQPMQELLLAGGDIRIENGELVVSRLTAQEAPPAVKLLQQEIGQRMPVVDLTDILVEVNAWVGFTDHLPGLENAHRNEGHPTLLLASILAAGCNIPLTDMARSSGLAYQSLWWTSSNYLRDDTLKSANNALVNEHHRQWLAAYWGDGTFSSSDGQRFPVSGKIRNARALPTYFGPGKGVTMQTHSSDQYVQYGSKVVPATLRDATVVLDEIVGNETDLRIAEHTTDTAGYTDIIFALFDLLNMSFCPRIRDLGDQKLSKIKGKAWIYPDLRFTGTVNPDYIRRHWDELIRLAGSIQSGRVTASLFISKLQAYPRQNNLTYVLQEYGQLIKTSFILRYLQSQPLRRRINAQLNKGEELHALRSWLWFGSDGMIRRKQQESQNESARCLTLLTNMVLLWNTVYMQDILKQLQSEGYAIEEAHFEYLSPGRYEHINRLGKYSFTDPNESGVPRRPLRNSNSTLNS